MTDCKGLFGKWFGHKFRRYLIKDALPVPKYITVDMEIACDFVNSMRNEYEIRCKRCGCKADE